MKAMLAASLVDSQQEQRSRLADRMSKPIQPATRLVLPGLGVSMREIPPAIEPQSVRPLLASAALPETVLPLRQKSEPFLGRGLDRIGATESIQHVSLSTMMATSGSLLGQLGLTSGPTVELAYAKQLLEHEHITSARMVLERAIGRYPQDERLRRLYHTIAPGRVVRRDIHYRDRVMEAAWIQAHRAQYRGKWVALLGEQVLGIADNLQTVLRCVRKHHLDEPPLIHHFID